MHLVQVHAGGMRQGVLEHLHLLQQRQRVQVGAKWSISRCSTFSNTLRGSR